MKLTLLTLAALGTTLVAAAPAATPTPPPRNLEPRKKHHKCHWYDGIIGRICFENPEWDPQTHAEENWRKMWNLPPKARDNDNTVVETEVQAEKRDDVQKEGVSAGACYPPGPWCGNGTAMSYMEPRNDALSGGDSDTDWTSDEEEGLHDNEDAESQSGEANDVKWTRDEKEYDGHEDKTERKVCPWYDWIIGHGCDA
jgi:hypothetical protein